MNDSKFSGTLTRALAGTVALALIGGCQAYKLVSPSSPTLVTGGYSVTPTVAWSKTTLMGDERWTTDGNALQEVAFADIGPGDRMFNMPIHTRAFPPGLIVSRTGENKLPAYRSDMTLLDVKDFIEASLTQIGAQNVRVGDMHPAKFGVLDGFRLDFGFDVKTGLAYRGFMAGAQTGGRLKLMIYSATEIFYFARGYAEAERLVASVQFQGLAAPMAAAMPMPTAAPATAEPVRPANPNLVALPPRPDGGARRAPNIQTAPAVFGEPAMAALGAGALPPCSSVPMVQPPGTRSISNTIGPGTAALPVAAPVRADVPCIPDAQPQGTTIRDVVRPGAAAQPITALPAGTPANAIMALPAGAAAPVQLPLCSSVPMVQPPGTRNINEAVAGGRLTATLPVEAPVRAAPCIPDPPPQGKTIRDVQSAPINSEAARTVQPVTAIQGPPAAQPVVAAPVPTPVQLPLCSTLPYEQPPGTRAISDTMGPVTARLPVATPVRVNRPCIPDAAPQGTTIRDLQYAPTSAQPSRSMEPVTSVPR